MHTAYFIDIQYINETILTLIKNNLNFNENNQYALFPFFFFFTGSAHPEMYLLHIVKSNNHWLLTFPNLQICTQLERRTKMDPL